MGLYAGQSVTADFRTFAATGALADADSTPTGTLVVNGTDNAATVTVTNKTTGQYKAAVTLPTTLAIGDVVQLSIAATVSSVASGGIILTDTVDVPSATTARTLYVATTGSDSNHGRSPSSAKLTLASAISAANRGDTIKILNGTFSGAATISKQVYIEGAGEGTTILSHSAGVLTITANGVEIRKLTVTCTATTGTGTYAIDFSSTYGTIIEDVAITGWVDGTYSLGAERFVLRRCKGTAAYDCYAVPGTLYGTLEDCYGYTSTEWDDTGTPISTPMSAIYALGSVGLRIIGGEYSASRGLQASEGGAATCGAYVGADTYIEGAVIKASVESGFTSEAVAVLCVDATTNAQVTLRNTRLYSSQGGGGANYNARLTTAKLVDAGGNQIDTTKLSFGVSSSSQFYRVADSQAGYTSTLATNLGTTNTRVDVVVSSVTGSSGTGARTVTVTVNDGSTALQNAIVRMTEGVNSYTASTNASGVATFNLDDATYTVAISKAGYSYAGTTLVVDGTETVTYSMTAVSVTPPSDPALTAAYLTTYNGQGTVEGGVVVSFKLEEGAGTSGYSYNSKTFTATSNSSTGLLTVNLVKSTQYSARRGNGEWVDFTTGSGSTYALPEVLGTP